MINKEEIFKLIDEHQVISFDVFDTLLFRNVFYPTDIFKIVEKKLKETTDVKEFYNLRITKEAESRKYVENGESNLDDIYNEISKEIGEKNSKLAKQLEIDLELEFIEANPFMKECFDYALKKKKKVLIISDMYLTKDQIKNMLIKSGYNEVPMYVSCEYKKGKGTGQLFELVREKEKISDQKWLHLGDNIHGDYNMAINQGLDAYHYKNVKESYTGKPPRTIEESIIAAAQCNYLYNGYDINYWDKFGAFYISPIYFGFTNWIYNLTKDKDNLFFIARDGYIINKIYDLFPKTNCYTKYIYVSRKSVLIPSLVDGNRDHMIKTLTVLNTVIDDTRRLKDLFKAATLDIDNPKYNKIIKQFGFNSFTDVINEDNYYNATKLIAYLTKDIEENLHKKHDTVINYLNEAGMKNFNKINVVDIGWAGSIQYSIKKLLNKDVEGYYFGTNASDEKEDLFSSTYGWAFDLEDKIDERDDILNNIMMYELIFSAPHGTTLGYKEGKTIEPILGEEQNSEIIEQFQSSALNIIKKYINFIEYFDYIDIDFCLHNYKKFIKEHNYNDMEMFTQLSNDLVLNSAKQYPYVEVISLHDIKTNFKQVHNKVRYSLWKDSFILSDDKSKIKKAQKIYKKKAEKIKNKEDITTYFKELRVKLIPFKVRKKLKKKYKKLKKLIRKIKNKIK